MKLRYINLLISLCFLLLFIITYVNETGLRKLFFCSISITFFIIFIIYSLKSELLLSEWENKNIGSSSQITELALLNDENEPIAFWDMYGKISLVIGVDFGENNVDVNLKNSTYSSMIDIEHAVLNYSNGNWYVEDIGSVNGTSIIKSDGKKYKLTSSKPCLVEKGDILCVSLTKLKLF